MARKLVFVLTFCVLSSVLFAADVTGKWTAQVPGRGGEMREQVYDFKQSGETLTGTMSFGQGEPAPIADGKVTGDNISFTVTREFGGNSIKWTFTGTVSGNEIKFKREGGRGQAREFTAKRAS